MKLDLKRKLFLRTYTNKHSQTTGGDYEWGTGARQVESASVCERQSNKHTKLIYWHLLLGSDRILSECAHREWTAVWKNSSVREGEREWHRQYALKNREAYREKEGGGLSYKHHNGSYSRTSSAFSSTQENQRWAITSLPLSPVFSLFLSPPSCLCSTGGGTAPAVSIGRQLQMLLFWESRCMCSSRCRKQSRAGGLEAGKGRVWFGSFSSTSSAAHRRMREHRAPRTCSWRQSVRQNPGSGRWVSRSSAKELSRTEPETFPLRLKGKEGKRREVEVHRKGKHGEFWETHRLL